jgi:hypothetical protein
MRAAGLASQSHEVSVVDVDGANVEHTSSRLLEMPRARRQGNDAAALATSDRLVIDGLRGARTSRIVDGRPGADIERQPG